MTFLRASARTFGARRVALLLSAAGAAAASTPAFAAGTASGSSIVNNATINYQVGGVAQTALTASNTIVVDRKVNLTVAEVGGATTSVVPGQAVAVTTFTVTNNSNATIDIGLGATQLAGGAAPFAGGNDNFNIGAPSMFVDTNANGTYDAGTDTAITYIDELAADASRTIFIVGSIAGTQVNGDIAAVVLTGTAQASGVIGTQGANITATAGANTAGVDTVLADAIGSDDLAADGKHSARDDYKVNAPVLTTAKLSRVISDPINGISANAKMIPGAVIEYCITVSNSATGATATTVAVTDSLPSTVTYQASFGIWEGGTVAASVCSGGTNTGTYSAPTVTGNLGSIAASATKTVYFRATIN
jgi:uncharacterized repeat protein (TIGR01451 family)